MLCLPTDGPPPPAAPTASRSCESMPLLIDWRSASSDETECDRLLPSHRVGDGASHAGAALACPGCAAGLPPPTGKGADAAAGASPASRRPRMHVGGVYARAGLSSATGGDRKQGADSALGAAPSPLRPEDAPGHAAARAAPAGHAALAPPTPPGAPNAEGAAAGALACAPLARGSAICDRKS
mmetsp:Transcript_37480/g.120464  ORF Transcript_37480/g.120464 Transcript_37480/m.120464 type:complete len:183 (-) Transcript_37480:765-1313(-)|eukprot:scaffold10474_cov122-Isochrysis_galbana.AAC.3